MDQAGLAGRAVVLRHVMADHEYCCGRRAEYEAGACMSHEPPPTTGLVRVLRLSQQKGAEHVGRGEIGVVTCV
jgi:hypothetical protein